MSVLPCTMSDIDPAVSRFPYTDYAKRVFAEQYQDKNIEDILEEEMVQEAAIKRILDGFSTEYAPKELYKEFDEETWFLSYPLSRIVISNIQNPVVKHLYVISESKRAVVNANSKLGDDGLSEAKPFTDFDQRREYSQIDLLERLEVITDSQVGENKLSVDPSVYNHTVPIEENVVFSSQLSSAVELKTVEEINKLLFWAVTERVLHNFPIKPPESMDMDMLTELSSTVTSSLQNKYQFSQRGMSGELSYKSIDKNISKFPVGIQNIAQSVSNNTLVTEDQRNLLIDSFLDCNIELSRIVDWFDWKADVTKSLGEDKVYDRQGKYAEKSIGMHAKNVSTLSSQGLLHTPSVLFTLAQYPAVYALLKDNGDLLPMSYNV